MQLGSRERNRANGPQSFARASCHYRPPPGAPWPSWTRLGRGRCAGALDALSRVARRRSGAGKGPFQGRGPARSVAERRDAVQTGRRPCRSVGRGSRVGRRPLQTSRARRRSTTQSSETRADSMRERLRRTSLPRRDPSRGGRGNHSQRGPGVGRGRASG